MAVTVVDSSTFNGGTVANDTTFLQDVTVLGTATVGTFTFTSGSLTGALTVGGLVTANLGLSVNNASSSFNYTATTSTTPTLLINNNISSQPSGYVAKFYAPSIGAGNDVLNSFGVSDSHSLTVLYKQASGSNPSITYFGVDNATPASPTVYFSYDSTGKFLNTGSIYADNFQVSGGSQSTFSTAGGISGTSSPLRVYNTYTGGDAYVYAGYATGLIDSSYACFFMGKGTNQALRLSYCAGPTEYIYMSQGSNATTGTPTLYHRFDSSMNLVSTSSAEFTSTTTALTLTNTSSATNVTIQKSYCAGLGNSQYIASSLGISDSQCASYKYFTDGTNSYLYLSVDQNTAGVPTNYTRIDAKGSIVTTGNLSITYTGTVFAIASIDSSTNGIIGTYYTSSLGTANYTGIKLGVSAAASTAIQYINSTTPYTYISTNQNTTGIPTSYLRIDNSGNLTTTGLLSRTLTSAAGTAIESTTNSNAAGTSSIYTIYNQPNLTTGDTIRSFIGKDTGTNFLVTTWTEGASQSAHTYSMNMNGIGGITLGGSGQLTVSTASTQPLSLVNNTQSTSSTMLTAYQGSLATSNTLTSYIGVSSSYATRLIYTHQTTNAATTTISMPQGSGSLALSAAGDLTLKGASGTQTAQVDNLGNVYFSGLYGNGTYAKGMLAGNYYTPTLAVISGDILTLTLVQAYFEIFGNLCKVHLNIGVRTNAVVSPATMVASCTFPVASAITQTYNAIGVMNCAEPGTSANHSATISGQTTATQLALITFNYVVKAGTSTATWTGSFVYQLF